MSDYVIFAGNSNPVLARKICEYLKEPLGGAKVKTFSDGETLIEIHENISRSYCARSVATNRLCPDLGQGR